jgi:hypothetical protein
MASVLEAEVRRVIAFHATASPAAFWDIFYPSLQAICKQADAQAVLSYHLDPPARTGSTEDGAVISMDLEGLFAHAARMPDDRIDVLKLHECVCNTGAALWLCSVFFCLISPRRRLHWSVLAELNTLSEQHNRDLVPIFVAFVVRASR